MCVYKYESTKEILTVIEVPVFREQPNDILELCNTNQRMVHHHRIERFKNLLRGDHAFPRNVTALHTRQRCHSSFFLIHQNPLI